MKLFFSPASPFVRKVLVVAAERGLRDRVEIVEAQVSPVNLDRAVRAHNPTGKIPTLLLDDGTALYDSRVIVEYLDGLGDGPGLIPREEPARSRALVVQSLADEMTDAAVLLRYETFLRPEALRWPEWILGQRDKIHGSLDELERNTMDALTRFDIGAIAVACGLGYLDFRFAEEKWREGRPRLSAWFEVIGQRPSLAQSAPR